MVRFESVSFCYRGSNVRSGAIYALRDINFELGEGSFRWLLGASGAGKTTLLRLMSLSLQPTGGEVSVLGSASSSLRRNVLARLRRQIGMIFSDFGLLPHLSAFDNVALPLRLGGRSEGQVRADVISMLRWLGLTDKVVSLPSDLSSSERQSVAIARAVIGRPRLLLADEPTVGLDTSQAKRVIHLLIELHRLGSTVVIATRDHSQANSYPGLAWVLTQGSLAEIGC